MGLALIDALPVQLLGLAVYSAAVGYRPWILAPTLVATLPFHLQPIGIAGLQFPITELALGAGIVGLLGRLAADRASGRRSPLTLRPAGAIDWIAAAFLAAGLLSLIPSEYPKQSLRELRWLVVEPVLVFYLVRATIRTSDEVMATLWVLALSGCAATAIAVADMAARGVLLDPAHRATAPYLSPNHLSLYLERAGAAALALGLFSRPPARVGWATAALNGLGLVRTLSFGAWLGSACAALLIIGLRSRRWALEAALAAALALGLALAVLPAERTWDRLDPSTGTGQFRLEVWTASVRMLADHPILGVGLDNFLYRYRTRYILPEAWEEPNISHPHNWILHFWLQLGLLGLIAASASAVWLGMAAHRAFYRPRASADRPLAATVVGTLAVFLAHGAIDNSYFLLDLAVVWWMLIALLAIRTGEGARG